MEERQASSIGASHMGGGWAGTRGCLGMCFRILLSFTLEVIDAVLS